MQNSHENHLLNFMTTPKLISSLKFRLEFELLDTCPKYSTRWVNIANKYVSKFSPIEDTDLLTLHLYLSTWTTNLWPKSVFNAGFPTKLSIISCVYLRYGLRTWNELCFRNRQVCYLLYCMHRIFGFYFSVCSFYSSVCSFGYLDIAFT